MDTTLPLMKFERFASDSLDYVRGAMTSAYCKHGLWIDESQARIAARHNQASLGGLSFNYLTYGVRLTVAVPEMPDFFLVDFPIAGRMNYRVATQEFSCEAGQCSIASPGDLLRSEWSQDSQLLTLKIERRAVERVLASLLETPITRPIRFEPVLDCRQGSGASFRAFIRFLIAEFDEFDSVRHSPLWSRQLERTVISALLATQRHTYSDVLESRARMTSPKCVRRAEAFIQDNLANPVSIDDIVAASGVPERTLFAAYKKYRGMPPMAQHRSLRLRAARNDLLNARTHESVASIACQWGFYHLGHFSRDYAARFGEKPSVTLRSRR